MARRRSYRRSTSQRAASLLALALPAPIARMAETRIGPFLILIGVPVLIITGLLRVNFQDGLPHFSLNREKASELRSTFRPDGTYQEWEQKAIDLYRATQGGQPAIYGSYATQQQSRFPSTEPAQYYDSNQLQAPARNPSYPMANTSGYGFSSVAAQTYGHVANQGYAAPAQSQYPATPSQGYPSSSYDAQAAQQQWQQQQRQFQAIPSAYPTNPVPQPYTQPQNRYQSPPYAAPHQGYGGNATNQGYFNQDRSATANGYQGSTTGEISRGRY